MKTMNDLVRVVGPEAAAALARHCGGTVLAVPRPARAAQHWLTKQLPPAAVAALAEEYGGERIYIPLARREVGRQMLEEGRTVAEVAAALTVSRRTVQRWAADL